MTGTAGAAGMCVTLPVSSRKNETCSVIAPACCSSVLAVAAFSFHQRGVLLGHFVHLRQRLVDLVETGRLLGAGDRNIGNNLCDLFDGSRRFRSATFPVRLTRSTPSWTCVDDDVIRSLMSLRRLGRTLREATHFRCHHRETATGIAGARCFHRRVEREQVGLPGDLIDDANNIGDLA